MDEIFRSLLREARANVLANKLRSFLPMLGIVWGVTNVVVFLALAEGVERGMIAALGEFGKDVVILRPGVTSANFRGHLPGKPVSFTPDNAAELRRRARLTDALSMEVSEEMPYQYANRNIRAVLCAVEPEYGSLRSMELSEGRFITADDMREQRHVVVLGRQLATRLFGSKPALHAEVRIREVAFLVVGVLQEKTASSRFSGPDNEMGFIPFTAARRIMDTRRLSAIILRPASVPAHTAAIQEVTDILAGKLHFSPADKEALNYWDFIETVDMYRGMIIGIQGVNILVGLLTLLVGGVGVMNVVLASVKERTAEIGLRKASGARRIDIAVQFLAEALLITLSAGTVGMLLGAGLCLAVPPIPIFTGQAELKPDASVMAWSFAVMVTVGLAAGTLPAISAARQSPAAALRYE
jgi:putative ABC transport system permease protein